MGNIANQKTALHEFTADGILVAAGIHGVVVGYFVGDEILNTLDLYDGQDATGTKIAAGEYFVAGNWVIFGAGFKPEFTNGLYADVTGTLPRCKVYTG